jgi:hypothetical protein
MLGCVAALSVAAIVAGSLQAPGRVLTCAPFGRIRPIDSQVRELLLDARRSSATVRELVAALEQSDLIVQIESLHPSARFRGCLRFMTAVEGGRFVRVSVKVQGWRQRPLPALAHELQHAVEVAQAPEIRDRTSLERAFRRVGWERRHLAFETEAALAVEERVRFEIARRHP